MVALRQVETPFYRGIGQRRGWGFSTLAQVIGRAEILFLRNNFVPATKRVRANLLNFSAPEIAEVVSGRKNFKTDAKSVETQTLRKQFDSGSKKVL